MRESFWAKAMLTGLLCRFQIGSQRPRLAEVHVLGLVAVAVVVVDQHPDHALERAGHLDLLRAEQRHAVETEVSGRDRGELRVEVGRWP